MLLELVNLDNKTRKYMLEEIDLDISNPQRFYMSQRLSSIGRDNYPILLREAAERYDEEWLANQLLQNNRLNTTEKRKTKNGFTTAKVPYNAHEILAEGEFNRFYIRGVCRVAIDASINELIVYRAKQVTNPRPDSQKKIGSRINAQALLDDLRIHQGIDTALGLPSGPNSGLSVKLP